MGLHLLGLESVAAAADSAGPRLTGTVTGIIHFQVPLWPCFKLKVGSARAAAPLDRQPVSETVADYQCERPASDSDSERSRSP
jgi:hypothetical protein